MYFLDTNICIYFLKGTHPQVAARLMKQTPDTVKVPSVVKAELLFGAAKSERREENERFVQRFLRPFGIVPFDDDATTVYAAVRSQTEARGTPVGPNDLLIAATVLSRGGVLVTNNAAEFHRVPGLAIENWTEAS